MALPHRGRRSVSLRTRLLLGVLGLLVVVFTVVGVVTQAVLRDYLVHRLDTQLSAAVDRSGRGYGDQAGAPGGFGGVPGQDHDGGSGQLPPCLGAGQGAGTVCAPVSAGTASDAALYDAAGTVTYLGASANAVLSTVPGDGRPHSVDLAGLGSYRVMVSSAHGQTVVTGLPLRDVDDTVTRFAVVGGSVAGAVILIAIALGAALISRTLRPLRRVAATAARVADLPLRTGEVALAERVPDDDPSTEVGAVGAAMNRMLDNVEEALTARQASETRVRQFVADASHELRTPLAAIRGYAELTRRSRDAEPPTVPRDVAHALRRVESEAARMTTLVEDLLLLARLDSGRPLAADDVDLSALVVDALSDAHATAPDHRWQLELGDDAPISVLGDAPRLHQVLANLLGNARTHTPPGTTVTVRLRREAAGVHLTVADDGPGIPTGLQPSLFERFARGDTSRSRAAGSTGLGLAIVEAVVTAHQGTVSVQSESGSTVFTVALPAAPGEARVPAPGTDSDLTAAAHGRPISLTEAG